MSIESFTSLTQLAGELEAGTISTYGQSDLPAGSELTLALEGRARAASSATTGPLRDNTAELLIGAGAAVLVIGIAAIVAA